ncbi:MAG: lipocalin-like domain-containing protein [Wenzhouxiangellaceae bacterium]|nr:lipocalin-like domain-containing protein [Wenzhouxiangellaceae bacterium]
MSRDSLVLLVLVTTLLAWLGLRANQPEPRASGIDSTGLLSAAPDSFRRVTGPEALNFPADHGVHQGFRNEWWYFTGNLKAADGRRFGFQFTLFRFGLDPQNGQQETLDSDFSADAIWMAHLALSDASGRRFLSEQRFARGALGLAGATADQWWLRDWTVTRSASGWQLDMAAGEFALSLALEPVKPIVLQGDNGYSRKGPEPGNASRYYSITRLATRGTLRLGARTADAAESTAKTPFADGGDVLEVEGLAWLDREWGSSQLGEGLDGWDWFALQLDDGRDLMLYRLRTNEGRASPYSAGMLVMPGGQSRVLAADEFTLEPQRYWRDRNGVEWPVAWRLMVPGENISLAVEPVFDQQRWDASVQYWEGAVDVLEPEGGARVGRGYLELSGYADTGSDMAR